MQFRFQLGYQLTKITCCSHKQAIAWCREDKVQVNQSIETNPKRLLGQHEEIALNGKIIRPGIQLKYLLFYKPNLYESTTNKAIPDNIFSNLPEVFHDCFPLGRLDKNSEGLLLLTNDGHAYKRLMDADLEKEYLVFTHQPVDEQLANAFQNPFQLGQRMTLPAYFEALDSHCFKVILKEGINRHIRRICAKNGNQVRQLIRIRFGKYLLGQLQPGAWMEVDEFSI